MGTSYIVEWRNCNEMVSSVLKWIGLGLLSSGLVVVLVLGSIRVRTTSREMREFKENWHRKEVGRLDSMILMSELNRSLIEMELRVLQVRVDSIDAIRAVAKGKVKSIEEWFKNRKR